MHDERVVQSVFEAIDEFNQIEGKSLARSLETQLFGESGELDSMGLVSLVLTVEAKVHEQLGQPIPLTDEKALSLRNSPFRTIGTLVEYIGTRLKDGNA